MAFKSAEDRTEEIYKGKFHLDNDGDHADVIFMYQQRHDALIGDMHYVKSAEYSGYVHCLGRGCPVCAKTIRIQTRLFIPLYNLDKSEFQFFDRSSYFQPQLFSEVFDKYPDPSQYVFRITRHGAAGSIDTKYDITAVAQNTWKTFDQICADNHIKFPECYDMITRELNSLELTELLSASPTNAAGAPTASYEVRPRGGNYAEVPLPTDSDLPPLPDLPPENFLDDGDDQAGPDEVEPEQPSVNGAVVDEPDSPDDIATPSF